MVFWDVYELLQELCNLIIYLLSVIKAIIYVCAQGVEHVIIFWLPVATHLFNCEGNVQDHHLPNPKRYIMFG